MNNAQARAYEQGLVSVIIPCYNHGRYVREAVESVLAQDYKNIEIVIVDDGSDDEGTTQILRDLRESYKEINLIETVNSGSASARNAGIAASKGEFIVPLDADDKIATSFCNRCLEAFAGRENLGVVFTDALLFGDYEREWKIREFSKIRQLVIQQILVTSMYRRKVFEDVKQINGHGYDPEFRKGNEDWDFWISVIEADWEFHHIPEQLFYYRKHGASLVTVAKENHREVFMKLIENHRDLYTKYMPELIIELQLELNHAHVKIDIEQKNMSSLGWLLRRILRTMLGK